MSTIQIPPMLCRHQDPLCLLDRLPASGPRCPATRTARRFATLITLYRPRIPPMLAWMLKIKEADALSIKPQSPPLGLLPQTNSTGGWRNQLDGTLSGETILLVPELPSAGGLPPWLSPTPVTSQTAWLSCPGLMGQLEPPSDQVMTRPTTWLSRSGMATSPQLGLDWSQGVPPTRLSFTPVTSLPWLSRPEVKSLVLTTTMRPRPRSEPTGVTRNEVNGNLEEEARNQRAPRPE